MAKYVKITCICIRKQCVVWASSSLKPTTQHAPALTMGSWTLNAPQHTSALFPWLHFFSKKPAMFVKNVIMLQWSHICFCNNLRCVFMSHRELLTVYCFSHRASGLFTGVHLKCCFTRLHIWQRILKPVHVHEDSWCLSFRDNWEESYYLIYVLVLCHRSVQHKSVWVGRLRQHMFAGLWILICSVLDHVFSFQTSAKSLFGLAHGN